MCGAADNACGATPTPQAVGLAPPRVRPVGGPVLVKIETAPGQFIKVLPEEADLLEMENNDGLP